MDNSPLKTYNIAKEDNTPAVLAFLGAQKLAALGRMFENKSGSLKSSAAGLKSSTSLPISLPCPCPSLLYRFKISSEG